MYTGLDFVHNVWEVKNMRSYLVNICMWIEEISDIELKSQYWLFFYVIKYIYNLIYIFYWFSADVVYLFQTISIFSFLWKWGRYISLRTINSTNKFNIYVRCYILSYCKGKIINFLSRITFFCNNTLLSIQNKDCFVLFLNVFLSFPFFNLK